ncbi:TerC family protein [Thermomonas sp. S9]|nr:TerC family protein [Thermomonas sp. S9]
MDLSFLASPDAWLTLVTLSALEIVLGIDNLVFISIAVSRLPEERKPLARRLGIAVACVTRILLLVTLAFLARMSQDLFQLFGQGISIRDLVLILGGAFLLVKGVLEIRDLITGGEDEDPRTTRASAVFALVIAQIAVIDIVFSLDSVITAVGIAEHIPIMVFAILVAVGDHAAGGQPAGALHRRQPHGQDAGAGLHSAGRRRAGARRARGARAQALHLLRHGLLGPGGVAEPADAAPRGGPPHSRRRRVVARRSLMTYCPWFLCRTCTRSTPSPSRSDR